MSVRELAFALYGHSAGLIRRDRGRMTMTYDPAYLAQTDATPLSLSMPLAEAVYPTRPIEAYLKGLLPDHGEVRDRWATRFGVRPGDTLGLVAAIGADTAGGAVFSAPEDLAELLARPGTVEPISEAHIATRLRALRSDEAAWYDSDQEHWSLAGGQGKFTLVSTDSGWGLATGSAASTHIVKPGIARIRSQALAEHVSMRTLHLLGLDVATTRYMRFEDQPAIVVTRYDRAVRTDGSVVRLHQEDLVQTFALDPRRKYEENRGPGVKAIDERLRVAASRESVTRFVDAMIAGYLLGAPDGHAKNYSLLLIGSAARLAPLYDVSTGLIPDETGRLRYRSVAMSIGGQKRFGEVEATNWERFARAALHPDSLVLARVADLAERLPDAFSDAIGELNGEPESAFLREKVHPNIAALAARTLEGLRRSRRVNGRTLTPFLATLETSSPSTAGDAEPWDSGS